MVRSIDEPRSAKDAWTGKEKPHFRVGSHTASVAIENLHGINIEFAVRALAPILISVEQSTQFFMPQCSRDHLFDDVITDWFGNKVIHTGC
jgi:hypothetical protein